MIGQKYLMPQVTAYFITIKQVLNKSLINYQLKLP